MTKIFISILALLGLAQSANAEKLNPEKQAQAALYVLGRDIPADKWQSVMNDDVDYIVKQDFPEPKKNTEAIFKNKTYKDSPLNRYPTIELPEALSYKYSVKQLFEMANKKPSTIKTALQSLPEAWEQQIDVLMASTHSPTPLVSPITNEQYFIYVSVPNYQYLFNSAFARNSLLFTKNPQKGIEKTCENVLFGKKLIVQENALLETMVAKTIASKSLQLLSFMLAQEPQKSLPPVCLSALKPLPTKEVALCAAGKKELAWSIAFATKARQETPTFNHEKTVLIYNKFWGNFCSPEYLAAVHADSTDLPTDYTPDKSLCEANSDTCNFYTKEPPNYREYHFRLMDLNAHLKLWQQARNDCCDASLKDTWPAERDFTVKGNQISIKSYSTFEGIVLSATCQSTTD